MQIRKLLKRLDRDLNAAAGFFEQNGFREQTELLDDAGRKVVDVLTDLASLREPVDMC
jgi:hypothetical protein